MNALRLGRAVLAAALCMSVAQDALADPSSAATSPSAIRSAASAETRRAPPPSVVIVASPPDSPVVPLLRAELRATGLDVVDEAEPDRATLSLHVTFAGQSLEVSVVDEATGRTTLREVFSQTDGTPMDARTAVLHAVELLHWHLSPHLAPETAAPKPAPQQQPLSEPAPDAFHLDAALLPLSSYSPGGTTPGLGAELDVLFRFRELGVRALGATLLVPGRIDRSAGSIDVTSRWAALEATWLSPETRSGTAFELGTGAALLDNALRGTPSADLLGGSDTLLTPALFVDLRARQRLTHSFAITLGTSALLPLTSDELRILDRKVGRYGQLIATLGLGFEVTLL